MGGYYGLSVNATAVPTRHCESRVLIAWSNKVVTAGLSNLRLPGLGQ